jgi:hypothetical protein
MIWLAIKNNYQMFYRDITIPLWATNRHDALMIAPDRKLQIEYYLDKVRSLSVTSARMPNADSAAKETIWDM